jgi:hypothetical protein
MTVSYTLGGVRLAYAQFEWRKYRGAIAEAVELHCPEENYGDLSKLAKSLAGKPTKLEIEGPGAPGASPSSKSLTIEGVYIDRVIRASTQLCRVILFDRRFALFRVLQAYDFNLTFGDGYLEGTRSLGATVAIERSFRGLSGDTASSDVFDFLHSLQSPSFTSKVGFFPFRKARDNIQTSGQSMPLSIAELSDIAAADLCVNNKGQLYFTGRTDVVGAKLPGRSSYSWEVEPGWQASDVTVTGIPKEFRVYFLERHCLRVRAFDPTTTINFGEPAELRVELEQVYADQGHLWTLAELLANNGFAASLLTDADIASSFWTDSFQGSGLEQFHGSFEFDRVHKAVRDGWRRLWKLKFNDAKGHIGGWSDWTFGQIQVDGSTIPRPVDCPYVSFLSAHSPATPGAQGFLGAKAAITHGALGQFNNAPFIPQWEGDESSGVIRLIQRMDSENNVLIPGELELDLTIQPLLNGVLDDDAGNLYDPGLYYLIQRDDITKARFKPKFEIVIFMCATRRAPNNRTRWHEEKVATKGGDVEFVELPPSPDMLCIRDFVWVNQTANQPQKDGLGPILNNGSLKIEAQQRAELWLTEHAYQLDGHGVAMSLMLFRDWEIEGPIQEIALVCDGAKITTRMTVGNLADAQQRKRFAEVNRIGKLWTTAGRKGSVS